MYNSFQEMIEGEGILEGSQIYYILLARENKQNRKKRSIKTKPDKKNKKSSKKEINQKKNNFALTINYEQEIQGEKLSSKELDILFSEGKRKCGYLREPHWKNEVYTGLCALTKNFDLCKYPRVIQRGEENDCEIMTKFQEQQVRKYQKELKKEKLYLEKKEFYSDRNGNPLKENELPQNTEFSRRVFFPVIYSTTPLRSEIINKKVIDRTFYK